MESLYPSIFWFSFAALLYVYFGYPLILFLLSVLFRTRHVMDDSYAPAVSILISARNEIESLPKKIDSLRNLDYPNGKLQILVASDASTDGTDDYLVQQMDIEWIAIPQQGGKNNALNKLLKRANGEILFFTDANTLLHPSALRGAVRHHSDPKTGLVAGELLYTKHEDQTAVEHGAGLYWKYENAIKRAESRLGSVLVVSGALFSVRREIVGQLDPQIANDLEIPIRTGAAGYRIYYEPTCLGFEKAHSNVKEELRRTSRIVSRGLNGFMRLLPVLTKTPFRLWQFISHKFLRWLTLPFAVLAWLSAFALSGQWFYFVLFWLGNIGWISAFIGIALLPLTPLPSFLRPFTLAAHLLIMNAAATWGLILAITGNTPATWVAPQSTREN